MNQFHRFFFLFPFQTELLSSSNNIPTIAGKCRRSTRLSIPETYSIYLTGDKRLTLLPALQQLQSVSAKSTQLDNCSLFRFGRDNNSALQVRGTALDRRTGRRRNRKPKLPTCLRQNKQIGPPPNCRSERMLGRGGNFD